MSYVNLHCHSHYSLLDGLGSPKRIIERAKELGMPAAAITDHGNMYGAFEFYKEALAAGIKPIIGCEIYVARRTRFDKTPQVDNRPYHLVLLAKNYKGYENLLEIVTKANLEGFYYKPRADYGLLKAHSEGLIALSACLQGQLPRAILSGNDEEVENMIKTHLEIFGKENYFLEVQDHAYNEDQVVVNEALVKLSEKHGLNLVATNDSHYPRRGDAEAHDVLLCIQTQTNVADETRMRYTGDFSIRTYEDMKESFKFAPGALENTLKIAEMCDLKLNFDQDLLPKFTTPQNEPAKNYLKQLCDEGLVKRFADKGVPIPQEYKDRLEYELGVINSMGFANYFLIVRDFVKYAKDNGIVVGPGRGSAAGAIVTWSLEITELDPIFHGLFFERFLNPERVSMPDIDIDFADKRRQEVLNYVVDKYGRENVAQIITFGTMTAKAVVRDVGRALGIPYTEVDRLAKLVPPPVLGKHAPLSVSIKEDPDFKHDYENNQISKKIIDFAMQLEGTVRHAGTHACAVVISGVPLIKNTPLQRAVGEDEGSVISQYSMKPLEELGLLKMDFLGLKNLTLIEDTEKLAKIMKNADIDLVHLPLDDELTFKLLQKADTTGVFQLESAGMRRYLKELKPSKFEDIVAMGALYRPGPMDWIPDYIKGKHNPEKVHYFHSSFKDILGETYGVAVYQEQILQIARSFAGFTLGEADILRKAVGKKNPKLLAEQREKFIKGAVAQGQKEKFSDEVFEKVILPFAGYGFNKAHASCYGMISYQTAYLKAHFPTEFMTALLKCDYGDTDRVVLEINECEEMGIKVLPPSINESFQNFTVIDDATIRFGLTAIKGVGEGPVEAIIKTRNQGGKFKDLEDFARRVPYESLNKKVIQALAYSGAMDEFGDRKQIASGFEEIVKFSKFAQTSEALGQTDIFGALVESGAEEMQSFRLPKVEKSSEIQQLQWEKAYLGMYVSKHPLDGLSRYLKKKVSLIGDLTKKNFGRMVKVSGMVSGIKKILTRSGGYMMVFVIEDPTAKVEVSIFPGKYQQLAPLVVEDQAVVIEGKFDNRRTCQVMAENIKTVSIEKMIEKAKELKIYNPEEKASRFTPFIGEIIGATIEEEKMRDFDFSGVAIETGEVYGKPSEPNPHPENLDNSENIDSNSSTSAQDVVPDTHPSDTYIIELDTSTTKETLAKIKALLQKFKGETPVIITLSVNGVAKKIKVPFGVLINEDFEKELKEIVKNS